MKRCFRWGSERESGGQGKWGNPIPEPGLGRVQPVIVFRVRVLAVVDGSIPRGGGPAKPPHRSSPMCSFAG